jgi:hypothetical protein
LEGDKNHNSAKTWQRPKLSPNFGLINLLSTTSKLFEKLILRSFQKHTEDRNVLNASQFDFRADHSMTLQYMRLAHQVTLNFNNNMSTAVIFFYFKKAFNTTWHTRLLHKLSELEFSTSLIKLITSFLTDRKFKALADGKFSTPCKIVVGVPQGSVLNPNIVESIHK